MATYQPPLDEMRFLLEEVLDAAQVTAWPGGEDATADTLNAVLEEAGRLCREVLHPLNLPGDIEGCHWRDGTVTTPAGFRDAYRIYADGGWTGLACDPAWGGQGLPEFLNFMVEEMICSANLAFGITPGLSRGAYNALRLHAAPELQRLTLPHLVSGRWTGTMCLTEPQAGTDLGLVRTRAEPGADGIYRITGSKIFISAGEHDLADNILHLVLARLPGAPAGVRGISLFLVPKFLILDEEGSLGERNAVHCTGIEHKMGIHASPTCTLSFDGARGWLVGAPNRGLAAMFTMMNEARLAVGIQGLGIAEIATQNALAYARERLQGRALTRSAAPGATSRPADPLTVHADIRRMLLTMRALTEGGRALALWVGLALDRQHRHPDAAARAEAADLVALLTPVVKAGLTDAGSEVANLALQIYGGHGYIRDHGIEQMIRDARIAQVYEGTNGVQALDLVGRKLPQDMGRLLRRFFHPLATMLEAPPPAGTETDPATAANYAALGKAFGRLQQATVTLAERGLKDPNEAAAVATDYLRLFFLVALGEMWLRLAMVAAAALPAALLPETGEPARARFLRAKLATARFFFARILPQTGTLAAVIQAGAGPVMGEDDLW